MDDRDEMTFHAKLKGPGPLRVGIVLASGLALLIGAAAVMAASPAPSGGTPTPTQQTQGGVGGFGGGGFGGPGGGMWGRDPGAMGVQGFGGPGFGMGMRGPGRGFGGPGFGQITIAAISGSDLSLKTADGWTRTISITSSTTISKGGQTIGIGDLAVGDEIRFHETRNADGTFTIDAVMVVIPHVAGAVSGVDATSFTLKAGDGTTWTVTLTGSTTYTLGTKTGSKSDLVVGAAVAVEGTQASGNTLTAIAVHIEIPRVAGQVTGKTADTITLTGRGGTTVTVHVGSGTTYVVPGIGSPSLSDISVGMIVVAEGTRNADGSITAATIHAAPSWAPRFRGAPTAPGASNAPGASSAPASQG